MPFYDVVCKECGKAEEVFKAMDYNFAPCSSCGGEVRQDYSGKIPAAKVQPEGCPRHNAWFQTEGKRRMALPDGHPDKLEPASKSSNLMHV